MRKAHQGIIFRKYVQCNHIKPVTFFGDLLGWKIFPSCGKPFIVVIQYEFISVY